MSDSNKRILLTVVACAAILLLWQIFSPSSNPPPKPDEKSGSTRSAKAKQPPATQPAASRPTSLPAHGPGVASKQAGPVSTSPVGELTTVRTREAIGVFTSRGATLHSWKLTDPRYRELKQAKLVQVDLVQTPPGKGPWPLQTTFVREDSDFQVPADAAFSRVKADRREVLYRWESQQVHVIKHFVTDARRPVVWMTLKVRNRTDRPLRQRLQLSLFNRQDPGQGAASFTNPFPKIAMVLCHVNGTLERRSASSIEGKDSNCMAAGCSGIGDGELSATGQVRWIGAGDTYFQTSVVPLSRDESRRCLLKVQQDQVTQATLQFGSGQIEPGKTLTRKFAISIGPKDLASLDAVTGPDREETNLSESINYGWFAVLCRPMLWLLQLFYGWFGNWGVAIILLTVLIKLLTLYWTQKSMRSMKAMQRLKPKIDQLREKFKDDKQRLNQETMALYKVHKVNPLGGCLPMVIQMPIWFALYRTLGNSVELYRSVFIPGWINDMTAPDPYYILPIAMGISMFAQQAITPQPLEGAQAKMMKYFMPIMFTVMMLSLPSGLTLYIFVNTVLTMLHQWYMNKTDKGDPSLIKQAKDPEGSRAAGVGAVPRKEPAQGEGARPRRKRVRRKK